MEQRISDGTLAAMIDGNHVNLTRSQSRDLQLDLRDTRQALAASEARAKGLRAILEHGCLQCGYVGPTETVE